MRRVAAFAFVAMLSALVAPYAAAGTATVKARDDYFTPQFRVLVPGDRVTWSVEGMHGHTITSYPGAPTSFDSSPNTTDTCDPAPTGGGGLLSPSPTPTALPDCLDQGETFEHTFDVVGTVDYYCKIHGNPNRRYKPSAPVGAQPCGMCGRILVKVPSSGRPATRNPYPTTTTSSRVEPSADPSPSESPSETIDPSLVATPDDGDGGSSAGTMRAVIAALAISLLSGVGYLVWRRYLQPE